MLTEDELRQSGRFLDGISAVVARFPHKFRHCTLEALTQGTEPLFCLIRAGVEKRGKNEFLDYGKVQLRREVFASADLRPRIEALINTSKLTTVLGDIVLDLRNSTPNQRFYASRSDYHGWPGYLYEIGVSQNSYVPREPLVGRRLPPFFDAKDAIRDWIRVPVSESDGRCRRLLLFVADFTARLEQMSFQDGILRVRNRFAPGVRLDLSVLAADAHQTYRKTKPLQKTQRFKLMENPTSLEVFITEESGHILDSFSEVQSHATRDRVIFAGAKYTEASMDLIRRGETDTVEFKEFIRLEDKKKAADIVKAVISFANAAGGTIFIGVTDDAEIEGVEANIPHEKRKAERFEEDYFAGIRRLLQQKLNRIPTMDTRSERIGDKTVFILHVEEGSAKPYFNVQTREIFIRRGASDVRPDPDTELRQMVGSGHGLGLAPLGWNQ